MHLINDALFASGVASLIAFAVFSLGFRLLGHRSYHFAAGAVIPAFFLAPWVAALAGGITAHITCILLANALTKRTSSDYLLPALIAASACIVFPPFVALTQETNEITRLITKGENEAWERVKQSSKAGAFVEAKYRPCVGSFGQPIPAPFPRSTPVLISRSDPVVCASGTVTLARETLGPEIAAQVAAVIEDLPKQLAIQPDVSARLDRLVGIKEG